MVIIQSDPAGTPLGEHTHTFEFGDCMGDCREERAFSRVQERSRSYQERSRTQERS